MAKLTNKKEGKSFSWIILFSWVVIFIWSIFLGYYVISETITNPTSPPNIRGSEGNMNVNPIVTPNNPSNPSNPQIPIVQVDQVSNNQEGTLHVIFSTDCGTFQDWQTLLLFHSAKVVKQQGPLTRIASGCDPEKQEQLTKLYKTLYPDYFVHFTPDFKTDAKTGRKYDFYNKPYGVLHWLDNSNPRVILGTVVALVDPDFIFLRPLTTQISGEPNLIVSGAVKMEDIFDKAGKGHPVAQQYGLGAPWVNDNHKKFNRTQICGPNSPCLKVPSEREGGRYYSVGPPYILERDDLHRLTKSWTSLVPRVYEGYPYLLAEMYAYSMAAAHEELPHLRMDHFMVSNIDAGDEGWKWIDSLGEDVCSPPINGIYYPDKPLPTFLHYCQTFRAGELGFWKREVDRGIFSCEANMFVDPPDNLSSYNYYMKHGNVSVVFFVLY